VIRYTENNLSWIKMYYSSQKNIFYFIYLRWKWNFLYFKARFLKIYSLNLDIITKMFDFIIFLPENY